jgi:hypothetical protein
MLERFGNASGAAETAERTLRACSLKPGFEREVRVLSAPIDRVIATDSPKWLVPWCNLSKGLAEYRAGNDQAALDWLAQARGLNVISARATLDLLTAMACQRLGRAGEARDALGRAVNLMETQLANTGTDVLDANVEDWLTCQILRKEAEGMIAR